MDNKLITVQEKVEMFQGVRRYDPQTGRAVLVMNIEDIIGSGTFSPLGTTVDRGGEGGQGRTDAL